MSINPVTLPLAIRDATPAELEQMKKAATKPTSISEFSFPILQLVFKSAVKRYLMDQKLVTERHFLNGQATIARDTVLRLFFSKKPH